VCRPFSSEPLEMLLHWIYTPHTAIDTYMCNTDYKAKLIVEIVGMDENQIMPSLKHGVHIGLWIVEIMKDG
jgi:hypothetical protein